MLKIFLALSLFLTACASKQLAHNAEKLPSTAEGKVDVTAEIITEYSDDYNILIQINFESKDGLWVRVDRAEIDFSNMDNQPYNIIVGKDLVAWADSKAEEKKIRQQNEDNSVMGIIATGGALAVLGVLSNRSSIADAGSILVAGGSGYGLYTGLKGSKARAQGVAQVPEAHLYTPFAIPSMSLVKKWVLINVPTGRVAKTALLKLTTVEGDTLNYRVRFTNL